MTDADLLDGWAAWMTLAGLAENTVRARTIHLRAFARTHGPLDRATRTDVARWLGRYRGPVSRATYASYLRTFYEWANGEGHITDNPTDRLPKMKMPRKAPRPIPPDELARALGIAPERERLWLELMAYAGLRCCEVAVHRAANLWQDSDGSWWLRVPHAKGGHDQQVPVPTWLGEKGSTAADWAPLTAQRVQKASAAILRAGGLGVHAARAAALLRHLDSRLDAEPATDTGADAARRPLDHGEVCGGRRPGRRGGGAGVAAGRLRQQNAPGPASGPRRNCPTPWELSGGFCATY
ncbi:MAG: hypothetical protein M3Q27_06560 [Actinomycetota bacterium]|nr:hypothetical protein [Actinomycetota bacterium]